MVKATGPATTTIVNQTTVPFNQTTLGTGDPNTSQQSGVGNQTNQTSQQSQQSGVGNQTNQGPLEKLGESFSNLVGG